MKPLTANPSHGSNCHAARDSLTLRQYTVDPHACARPRLSAVCASTSTRCSPSGDRSVPSLMDERLPIGAQHAAAPLIGAAHHDRRHDVADEKSERQPVARDDR